MGNRGRAVSVIDRITINPNYSSPLYSLPFFKTAVITADGRM